MKKQYCLGFAFDPPKEYVLMIKKARPKWQRGRFNGVGGKVEEGETFLESMVREFEEETGIHTTQSQWDHYLDKSSPGEDGFMVKVYRAFNIPISSAEGNEDEPALIWRVSAILDPSNKASMLSNIPWVVAMALDPEFDGAHVRYRS